MKKKILLLLLGICSLNACKETSKGEKKLEAEIYLEHSFRLSKEIGEKPIDLLASATKITATDNLGITHDFNKDQIEFCKQLILNDRGYLFDVKKKVLFIPTYRLTFHSDQKESVVDISIPSKQIRFRNDEDKNPSIIILDDDPMSEQIEELFSGIITKQH